MKSQPSIYLLGNNERESPLLLLLNKLVEEFAEEGQFLTSLDHTDYLSCYSQDSQSIQTMLPVLVFRPFHSRCIAPFVMRCTEFNFPVRTRCGGTGVVGGAIASQGGILLLTGHLRKVLAFDAQTGIARIEPGVTPSDLNALDSHWQVPLEMQTNGVAGLGGCVNTNAYGYHQTNQTLLSQSIISATLVDGKGSVLQVPAALICGSEGLFGIVTSLEIRLIRALSPKKYFRLTCGWDFLFAHWESVRLVQGLEVLWWEKDTECFTGTLHIESWRFKSIKKRFEELFESKIEWKENLSFFSEPMLGRQHARLHSIFAPTKLPFIIPLVEQLCLDNGLKFDCRANVLEGSLYLYLSAQETQANFKGQFERFMVQWIHVLETHGGELSSRHGIGSLLSAYTPPFYSEEDLMFIKDLAASFDPQQLFSRDQQFFPKEGKCLVRKREDH